MSRKYARNIPVVAVCETESEYFIFPVGLSTNVAVSFMSTELSAHTMINCTPLYMVRSTAFPDGSFTVAIMSSENHCFRVILSVQVILFDGY